MTGDDDVGATGTVYPNLADPGNTAKAYEDAPLHRCTAARMVIIAKDYDLPRDIYTLNKEPLFHAIYDHMLTDQGCTTCLGNCKPTEHIFPALEAPPKERTTPRTPVTSPPPTGGGTGGRSGTGNNLSPNSRIIQNDNSLDLDLGNPANPALFEGQMLSDALSDEVLSLADNVNQGAMNIRNTRTYQRLTLDDIAKDQERIRAALDKQEKEDDARRKRELAAKKKSKEPSQAQILAAIKDKRKEAAKLYQERKARKEAQHQRDLAAAEPQSRVIPVNQRSRMPPHPTVSEPLDEFTIEDDEVVDDDPFERVPDAPLTAKNLVKMVDLLMDAREKRSHRSLSLGDADMRGIGSVPHNAPNTGKLAMRAVQNRAMADRLGLAPMPNLSIEGDPTDLDCTKLKKYMTSGANRTPGMFVERQTTWPEQCLTPAAPGYKKVKHANLSFIEYVEGMLGKFLMETPGDKLDPILANKLTYLRNMCSMHHTLDLKSLLSISDRFLTGWENNSFEWNDWSRIDVFLKEARFQELVNCMAGKSGGPRGRDDGHGKSGNPPNGGSNIHGVPTEFLKENKLCIKYNKDPKSCPETGDHPQKFKEEVTLSHKCAGCMKFGKSSGEGHGVSTCKNGPYGRKQSFR